MTGARDQDGSGAPSGDPLRVLGILVRTWASALHVSGGTGG